MQPADMDRFRAVMAGMAKLYERELDAPLMDAYWLALRRWSLHEFEQAAGHLMTTSKFMPRPADFNELRKAARPTAGEAWAEVLEHIKGGYRSGGLNPETDHAVRTLGGYRALAMLDADQLPWLERRFAEHYGDMAAVAETRTALSHITGPRLAVETMKRLGLDNQPPVKALPTQ